MVADLLDRIPRQGDYLFPAARDKIKGKTATVFNGWGKPKTTFDDPCGLSGWQLHDLRRTFAALGVSLPTIEKLLNHVSGSFAGIVSVYQRHNWLPEMREATKIWESWLTAMMEEREPCTTHARNSAHIPLKPQRDRESQRHHSPPY